MNESLGTYTSWSGRKSYADELEMVQGALEDEDEQETLRKYLQPLATIVIDTFVSKQPCKNSPPSELLNAAFTHFPTAIRKYMKRKEKSGTSSKFSTYYEWFMRQGLAEYCNEARGNG